MFSSALYYAVFALCSAALSDDLAAVSSDAGVLSSLVAGWSSGAGLQGALVIQQSYDPLSSAVAALGSSAGSASESDITSGASAVVGLANSVSGLLGALTQKAGDFAGVGAASIVTGDINGLSGTSAQILSDLVKAANGNISPELADAGNSLGAAFSSAISAFSAKAVEFPSLSAGGSSGDESSSEGSAAPTATSEGASEAAPASTTAAPSNGTTNGTTNGTVVVEQTVVETVCTKEECTGVHTANGAIRNGAVVGVIGLAAAALL